MVDRAEQKERTRKKLVDATLALSAEKGLASLSLREVSKEAGITPAAFYRHFHDMEELGLVLIVEVGQGLRQLLREARRQVAKGGGSGVRASVEAFLGYIAENQNLFRVLQGERQGSSPAFRKALFSELGRFIEDVAEDLERESARLKAPIHDPALAAEAVIAVTFTLGGEALDLPKHRRLELAERIIKEIKMILRGARTEASPRRNRHGRRPA